MATRAVNGKSRGLHFDEDKLKEMCQAASDILDVKIYGGDCIVGADGTVRIIDFNDWPSFAPCRQDAAPYIARMCAFGHQGMAKERC